MANFTTHIAVGTVVSGALATLTLAADVVGPESLIAVTLAGVVGSVLPDIDLKDSRPSRALFAGLGIFFSFAVLFTCAGKYSIAELWILWLGTLVGIRYGLHAIFHRISVHRGIWHSLLATVFVSVLTAVMFKYVLGRPDGVAWLGAGFMAIGYLTHLTLDEIYSVDVLDTHIKKSFGTALKPVDTKHWVHTATMAVATIALIAISPTTSTFVEGMSSKPMWAGLRQRMLPEHAWFGIVPAFRQAAVPAPVDPGLVTGSLPETPAAVPMPAAAASQASPAK